MKHHHEHKNTWLEPNNLKIIWKLHHDLKDKTKYEQMQIIINVFVLFQVTAPELCISSIDEIIIYILFGLSSNLYYTWGHIVWTMLTEHAIFWNLAFCSVQKCNNLHIQYATSCTLNLCKCTEFCTFKSYERAKSCILCKCARPCTFTGQDFAFYHTFA